MPLRCQDMMERKVPPPSCSLEPSASSMQKENMHPTDHTAGMARRDCTAGIPRRGLSQDRDDLARRK